MVALVVDHVRRAADIFSDLAGRTAVGMAAYWPNGKLFRNAAWWSTIFGGTLVLGVNVVIVVFEVAFVNVFVLMVDK